jgi:hypothetical protein
MEQEVLDSGARHDLVDDRDYPYEAFIGYANETDMPDSYDVEAEYGPIPTKDQGLTKACGGFGVSYYAEALNLIETRKFKAFSPRYYYAWTHLRNGGSFTRDNVLRLVNAGAAPETLFPTVPITEEHLRDKTGHSAELDKVASRYRGKIATNLAKGSSFELYKLAIWHGYGVVLSLNLSSAGWNSSPVRPPKTSGEKIAGHIMYAKGYGSDEHGEYILLKDSYFSGDKKIYQDYFDAGMVHSAWTVIDQPNDWEEKDMVDWGNANGILYAITKKTDNPEAQALADALNNGNQGAVTEIIEKAILTKIQEQ